MKRLMRLIETKRVDPLMMTTHRFPFADIQTAYDEWSARGATFLTPPIDRGREIRCYMRDPDGHLIEVGQLTGNPETTR